MQFLAWKEHCHENHGSPACKHCFVSATGTMGPRNKRHKSNNIVTSIEAPKASMATLGRFHLSPGFSSILQQVRENPGNKLSHKPWEMTGLGSQKMHLQCNQQQQIRIDQANTIGIDGYIGSKVLICFYLYHGLNQRPQCRHWYHEDLTIVKVSFPYD